MYMYELSVFTANIYLERNAHRHAYEVQSLLIVFMMPGTASCRERV